MHGCVWGVFLLLLWSFLWKEKFKHTLSARICPGWRSSREATSLSCEIGVKLPIQFILPPFFRGITERRFSHLLLNTSTYSWDYSCCLKNSCGGCWKKHNFTLGNRENRESERFVDAVAAAARGADVNEPMQTGSWLLSVRLMWHHWNSVGARPRAWTPDWVGGESRKQIRDWSIWPWKLGWPQHASPERLGSLTTSVMLGTLGGTSNQTGLTQTASLHHALGNRNMMIPG